MTLLEHATRPLVTLMLITTLCYGFVMDKVSGETFVAIVSSVVSFWFAQRGQEQRSTDRMAADSAGATATAPPSGGTATATVTPTLKGD